MDKQRLRNLTTTRLHTKMEHIYKDLEFITGMEGIMTHMLPNVMKAVLPWLKEIVTDDEYWDDKFNQELEGEFNINPMSKDDRDSMLDRYMKLPSPFEKNQAV